WPPLSVLHPPLPIPPLASTQCPHPLCHSLHWLPLSIFHPSLPILHWPPFSVLQPPLPILHSSTQCPPPLSANPSTGLHSVSSTPLFQSLHLASTQCPPPLSANPSTGLHSVSSHPLCQSLHWPPLSVLTPSL
ncbi:unnamed protein product, partial [Staurois parvus]